MERKLRCRNLTKGQRFSTGCCLKNLCWSVGRFDGLLIFEKECFGTTPTQDLITSQDTLINFQGLWHTAEALYKNNGYGRYLTVWIPILYHIQTDILGSFMAHGVEIQSIS